VLNTHHGESAKMNVYKVIEGVSDASNGALDCMSEGLPVIHTVKQHKAALDHEGASTAKKALFLTGYSLLGFLEHWEKLKPAVMKVKDGCVEVYQGIKEPGLPDDKFEEEKDRIDDKRRAACAALPPKQPTPPSQPVKIPEPAIQVPAPEVLEPAGVIVEPGDQQGN